MRDAPINMVGNKRAARASFDPSGAKHEVINNQLALAPEQVVKRFFTARSIKQVFLLYFFPGKFAALPAQVVAQARELLFLFQKFLSRRKPFRWRHDFWILHSACCCSHDHFSFRFVVSTAFSFAWSLVGPSLAASAVTPPAEITPATIRAALAMHAGHISVLVPLRAFTLWPALRPACACVRECASSLGSPRRDGRR